MTEKYPHFRDTLTYIAGDMEAAREGLNEMDPDWSPAHERAATLAFDKQVASARLDAWQKATERKSPDKGTAAELLHSLTRNRNRRL